MRFREGTIRERARVGVVVALLLLCALPGVRADLPPGTATGEVVREEPLRRVGQIFILGNETVPHGVILRQLCLYPGAVLSTPDLRAAERNLERLGLFHVDAARDLRPTVTALTSGGEERFVDVRVEVQEKPNARWLWHLHRGARALAAWPLGGPSAALASYFGE
jgi:hypothetical protein